MKSKLKLLHTFYDVDPTCLKGYLGARNHPLGTDLVVKISDRLLPTDMQHFLTVALSRGMEPRFVPPARLGRGCARVYRRGPA